MNILHLTVDYPPPLTGGLPGQVHGLAHALASRHTVAVAASGADRDDGPIYVFGADPVPDLLPSHDLPHLARVNAGLTKAILTASRSGPWDLIHAHDWMVAPAAVIARQVLGIPVVASIHTDAGSTSVGSPEERERRLDWEASLARASSLLLAVSTPIRDLLSERYRDVPSRHLPNGIDVARFTRPRVQRHACRILFVGRLVPYKGCQDAIRAIGLLAREWPEIELEIVGDGFYRPELEALVERLNLTSRISFQGWKDGIALVDAYHRATIVVVPSHEEAFGLVAIEAMAAGTPVIASSIPAFRSYMDHERTGLLADPNDPADLARQIDTLLRDADLHSTLAANASKDVLPRHDWSNILNLAESAYRGVLSGTT